MDKILQKKIIFSIALLTTFLSIFLIYKSISQTAEIKSNEIKVEELQKDIKEKDTDIEDLKEKVILVSSENTTNETAIKDEDDVPESKEEIKSDTNTEAIALIKTFIGKEYNYNTDTYISRLDDIKTLMSEEAYESLHGQYKLEKPEVDITSTLKSVDVFESLDDKNTFIALADSSYESDGNTIDLGQDVFILKVETKDGSSKITSANIPTSLE